jgi:hypothetical protein
VHKLELLNEVLAAAKEKREQCIRRQWRYKRSNGETVILRDLFDKILAWANKFKEIGDVVVQFDPVHTALPWAGVRFFLQVGKSAIPTDKMVINRRLRLPSVILKPLARSSKG